MRVETDKYPSFTLPYTVQPIQIKVPREYAIKMDDGFSYDDETKIVTLGKNYAVLLNLYLVNEH